MQMQAREGQRVFSRQHGGGCKRPDSELFRITAASFCFLFFTLCFHLDDVESVRSRLPGSTLPCRRYLLKLYTVKL